MMWQCNGIRADAVRWRVFAATPATPATPFIHIGAQRVSEAGTAPKWVWYDSKDDADPANSNLAVPFGNPLSLWNSSDAL
jgi:hypothetical protein